MTENHPSARAAPPDHPNVLVMPPVLYLAGILTGVALERLAPLPLADLPEWARALGGVLILAGLALIFWGRRTLEQAGTSYRPDQPATVLVRTGPFRFSRNPLYVGLGSVMTGLALGLSAPWILVMELPVTAILYRGVVCREERYLERTFGSDYADYRSTVRRWL